MSRRFHGFDLVAAIAFAKDGARTALGEEAVSLVLCGGEPDGRLLDTTGVPDEVNAALTGAAAPWVIRLLRRSGEPVRVPAEDLTQEVPQLSTSLRQHEIGWLALFPLLGESGLVGFMAVPTDAADDSDDPSGDRWRVFCRGLAGLQLAGASAALRVGVERERRRPAQLHDGVLVLDRWDRVAFADGWFRGSQVVTSGEPFAEPLERLSCADLLGSIPESASGRLDWQEHVLPGSDEAGHAVALAVVRLGRDDGGLEGGRALFLRDLRSERPEDEDGVSRMRALAQRVAHLSDEVARGLLGGGDRRGQPTDALADRLGAEVEEAARMVSHALDCCSTDDEQRAVRLNSLIEDVAERYRSGLASEHVSVFSFLEPELPTVPGDRLALLRAVRLLVQDARESLRPRGGALTVRTWADESWVYGAVSDDGNGRTEPTGVVGRPLFDAGPDSASGLEQARHLVERFGGRLLVESRPGVWNRVTLMLRQERRSGRRRRTDDVAVIVQPVAGETAGLSVLVVDDNAALRSVLRRYLERRGHVVTEATDGEEGIRLVRRQEFDRLIVDMQMPKKDGAEFYEELETVDPDMQCRTIFVTGGFLNEAAERFIRDSGRPSVTKPFDLAEMAKTVEG